MSGGLFSGESIKIPRATAEGNDKDLYDRFRNQITIYPVSVVGIRAIELVDGE